MQSVRDAKERALSQLAQARIERQGEEEQIRERTEAEREKLQRKKLEGALNNQKKWEAELGGEKEYRKELKTKLQLDREREQANKFRMAEAIRVGKKNQKQAKFFND